MFNNYDYPFVIFGSPIKHSQSPRIYQLFANQLHIDSHIYGKIQTTRECFANRLNEFFSCSIAKGANITMPFKQQAYSLANILTERALLAGSVNTLKKLENDHLVGDNTDGIGLLSDLKRLHLIHPQDNILILGAGGAAYGIILPLLYYNCSIIVTNRTFIRAQNMALRFRAYGNITAVDRNRLSKLRVDLIINATSCSLNGIMPFLPRKVISSHTCCYDLFYQNNLTPFLQWGKEQGAKFCADGLGMLVGQAAYSFLLWYGVLPEISSVIKTLQDERSISRRAE
ncbi:MAG: shikimate dehydrogenase [Candidatus Dasytiphilus stammeri]